MKGQSFSRLSILLDINGIKDLNYIREQKNGLKIGATTTLTDIASSPLVAGRYPLLSQAANQVAVPQIRNVGTLGGNLCQKPRCWYFRGKLFKDCFRKGGDNCYASTGENQYHAIFGEDNCNMVCPSDMATALTALNARVEIATPREISWFPSNSSMSGRKRIFLKRPYSVPPKWYWLWRFLFRLRFPKASI